MAKWRPTSTMAVAEAKTFVLVNVPEVNDKADYVSDFLECILNQTVHCVCLLPDVPDRVLVTMENKIDLNHASHLVSKEKFEDVTLTLEPAALCNVVQVDGHLSRLALANVERYFHREFAQGQAAFSSYCIHVPLSGMYAFAFSSPEVRKRVLSHKQHHISHQGDSFDIEVSPFYLNFQGRIPFQGKLLLKALEMGMNQSDDAVSDEIYSLKSFQSQRGDKDCALIESNSKDVIISVYSDRKSFIKKIPKMDLRRSKSEESLLSPQTVLHRGESLDDRNVDVTVEFSNAYFNYISHHHQCELCEAMKSVQWFVNWRWDKTAVHFSGGEEAVREATALMERIHRNVRKELLYVKTLLEKDL